MSNIEAEKAQIKYEKNQTKKFVKLRRGCPWIEAACSEGGKPLLLCKGIGERCLPDNCPVWYWRNQP